MTQNTFMGKSIYPGQKRSTMPYGSRVYPVHSGRHRLDMPLLKETLLILKEHIDVPDELFARMYERLLESYSEFVQMIPENEEMPSQSMLGNGLKRSIAMVAEFKEKIVAQQGRRFLETDRGLRWVFAVFSSALLFRIAKLFVDKQISLCDHQGRFVCHWQYYHGSLLRYGKYFRMRYIPSSSSENVADMTIVLSKLLMPQLAFSWLAEDPLVLHHWFKALNIEDEIFSVFQMGLDVDVLIRQLNIQIETPDEHVVAHETLLAEEYWEWMIDQIKQNSGGSLDQDGWGVVDGELIFDIDRYAKAFAKYRGISTDRLMGQLGLSGLIVMSDSGFHYRNLHQLSSGGLSTTGLYASANKSDLLDAKRFVGVDIASANAIFNRGQLQESSDEYGLTGVAGQLLSRLMGTFLGGLSDGALLGKTGGVIL